MQVMQNHQHTNGVLEDYCDGSIYKKHPLFSTNPNALQIMFYYDDVEVVNPIGSRVKKHKLGKLEIIIIAINANGSITYM